VNRSWTLAGHRKQVAYENPCGRRVNVLAAYVPDGPMPSLTWGNEPAGALVAEQLVSFVRQIPRPSGQPLVVVMDNGSIHVSKTVKHARAALRQEHIYLYYLPPYSPALNAIEPIFGAIKQHDLPERRYTSVPALEVAIDAAFARAETRLLARTAPQLRRSA
jgi:hypothetical protein